MPIQVGISRVLSFASFALLARLSLPNPRRPRLLVVRLRSARGAAVAMCRPDAPPRPARPAGLVQPRVGLQWSAAWRSGCVGRRAYKRLLQQTEDSSRQETTLSWAAALTGRSPHRLVDTGMSAAAAPAGRDSESIGLGCVHSASV